MWMLAFTWRGIGVCAECSAIPFRVLGLLLRNYQLQDVTELSGLLRCCSRYDGISRDIMEFDGLRLRSYTES